MEEINYHTELSEIQRQYNTKEFDNGLSILSIYLVAKVLPLDRILGNSIGWLVLIMMISLTLASYLEFDSLSIYTEKKDSKN